MTRKQLRQLEVFLQFKDRDMSVGELLWFNRRLYAVILPVAFVSVIVSYYLSGSFWAWIFAVAYAALILRDVGQYWASKRVWPVVREVLDWDKIQALHATLK